MKRGGLGLLIFVLVGMFDDLSLARMLTVIAPNITIRAGPGNSYKSVGKVTQTAQYEVMEERGDWHRIQLEDGKTGWVSGEGVALDQTSRSVKIIAASQSDTVQQRFALVIGNSKYADSPLQNPRNDATAMDAMLRQLGFKVTFLLDANYRTMKEAIQKFTTGIPQGSAGLFYFSGHGMQMAGENYLIPIGEVYNGPTDVEYGAVKANWVLGRMEDAGMDVKLIILDACRNNPMGRSWTRDASGGGLAPMDAVKGSLIAYSTSPGQTASDGTGRNSPYTEQLLRQMPTPGQAVETMFKRVRVGVQQETKAKQIPWESSSLTGDFYFGGQAVMPPPPKIPPEPPPLQLGGLSILGRVPGVEVWVDAEKIGETRAGGPLSWENLKPGNYRVTARKAGYEPWERVVAVAANERKEVVIDIKPLPAPPPPEPPKKAEPPPLQLGGLSILGRVPGVEVWVDAEKIGETRAGGPLRWENLKPGRYLVRAHKVGYESWEREVAVVANKQTEVVIDIKPHPAPLPPVVSPPPSMTGGRKRIDPGPITP